jgi:carboxylesterase type B
MPRSAASFDGAIMESGALTLWVARPMAQAETVFARALRAAGCADAVCLARRSAANLSAVVRTTTSHARAPTFFMAFAPTIDGAELTEHPYLLAGRGELMRVPVLVGTNLDEGSSFESLAPTASAANMSAAWQRWYGDVMGPQTAPTLTALYYTNVSYPPSPPSHRHSRAWWAAERALTDSNFACGTRRLAMGLGGHVRLFLYQFVATTWAPCAIPDPEPSPQPGHAQPFSLRR